MNMVPIWSTPIESPAASHQDLKSARPSLSESVSVWRLLPPAIPGPIFAISIRESHKRSELIRRFSPGAAICGSHFHPGSCRPLSGLHPDRMVSFESTQADQAVNENLGGDMTESTRPMRRQDIRRENEKAILLAAEKVFAEAG